MRLIFKDRLRLRSTDTQIIPITMIPNTNKIKIDLMDFHQLIAILPGANS